jgi:hypothetical protein
MTTIEALTSLALISGAVSATLDMYSEVEAQALASNDAVKTQTDCYKARDFKCMKAREKFEALVTEAKE